MKKYGMAALLKAAKKGNLDQLKEILDNSEFTINSSDSTGMTILIYSSWYGQKDIVKFAIDNGACIDQRNKFGMTALLYAVAGKDLETVKMLIEAGAYKNITDFKGWSPISMAEFPIFKNKEIETYLKGV
jgi:ankyrin repeat protein